MVTSRKPDFTTVTESFESSATADQLSILYTRYDLATQFAIAKDVLEVACGTGTGLGLLAGAARMVVGGDLEVSNCRTAKASYPGRPRIDVISLDALKLPFPCDSFDLIILFEALYYLPDASEFMREARRVLRPGGTLIISSVNPEWPGFNPSPFSTKYFTAAELSEALCLTQFRVRVLAGFPDKQSDTMMRALVALIRRAAISLHLIPATMKGKQLLKRLFYGKLTPIPREVKLGLASLEPLIEIDPRRGAGMSRMIYAIATIAKGSVCALAMWML